MNRAAWALLSLLLAGCPRSDDDAPPPCSTASQDLPSEAALVASWNAIKQTGLSQIHVAAGFQAPERVPGAANTIGWEDSAFISPDGTALWFAYLPGDLIAWVGNTGGDPAQFPAYQRGPVRGTPPSPQPLFEGFGCSFLDGATCAPVPFPYVHAGGTFSEQQAADGSWYYSTYNSGVDLHRNGVLLPPPVNTASDEDDPHFLASAWGNELFFDSGNRPGGTGTGGDIWLSSESAGTWSTPAALASPINQAGSRSMQPHFRADNTLYFSSNRDDGKLAIWSSLRTGAASWAAPQKLVWTDAVSAVAGIGEPTLTADGLWMYFVVVFQDTSVTPTRYDADVCRVRTGP